MRPILRAVAATSTALALASCSSTGSVDNGHTALQRYSCCSPGDVEAVRHPGETVELHWIATPLGPTANHPVSTVRLRASLSGPFASVSALKASALAASTGPGTVAAPVIVTTDEVGEAPVSVIVIPTDAPAGYYELTTTIDQDGGQLMGGSVIAVARR